MRLADGVGDLHLAAAGQPGGDHVLGDPAHGVRGRPVDLRRVLAREGAAAVPRHAAVRVDDDLAAGEAGVAHRATDLEPAGRVDEQPEVVGVDADAVDHGLDDVVGDVGLQQVLERHVGGVLGRHDHGVEGDGAVTVVRDRHLGLAVGAQVGHLAALAHLGEPLGEPVGQPDRQRHELGGVVAGVPEHEALVAGALRVERDRRRPRRGPRRRCRRPARCRATATPIETSTPQERPSKPFCEESYPMPRTVERTIPGMSA